MKLSRKKEYLVLENRKLVYYFINRLGVVPNSERYKELESIGNMGLVKAAITFDESKGVKFASYAASCINNEIYMHFRSEKKYANDVSLDHPIANDGKGNEITFGETIEDSKSNFAEKIINEDVLVRLVNIILNCLEKRDRLVVLYRMGKITQQEIANKLSCSRSYICRIENRAILKIKELSKEQLLYKQVFVMSKSGEMYIITFSSKDVKKFNQIFAALLRSLLSIENLIDFKVSCNRDWIQIVVPSDQESFAFIAEVIKAIDTFQEDSS